MKTLHVAQLYRKLRMRRCVRTSVVLLCGGVLAVTGRPDALSAQGARFEWNGRIPSGGFIEVRAIWGDIHAELASGSNVEVVAVKSGRRSNFSLVNIEILEDEDGVVICTLYPSSRRHPRTDCSRRRRGGNIDDVGVAVDFTVRVPSNVRFVARTVSGDVVAHALESQVSAHSVTGDVDVSTSGLATASTVSGSITASLGRSDWDGTLSFNTVSGDITLYLPEILNSDVSFESVSGDFQSDFPVELRMRSGFRAGRLRGRIGDGGRHLELRTVSGNIDLRIRR